MASPIQVILDANNYQSAREVPGGGGEAKDFFALRDDQFKDHQLNLYNQLIGISNVLRGQEKSKIGYLKICLQREAWAKSHRPFEVLFKPSITPIVGGDDIGVVIVKVLPSQLEKIAEKILTAEPETRMKFNKLREKEVPNPSGVRSEVGAIEEFKLYDAHDRRNFSAEDSISWLSQRITGSAYEVELFEVPNPKDGCDDQTRLMYESFIEGLSENGGGLYARLLSNSIRGVPSISIRLEQTNQPALISFSSNIQSRGNEVQAFDPNPKRHLKLLSFLDHHPLVRRISLPAIISTSQSMPSREKPQKVFVPEKEVGKDYPKMGIIDCGLSKSLGDWVVDRWDFLDSADTDLHHGTFIGGLLVAGQQLNGDECCPDSDGLELFDVGVFPTQKSAFPDYFPEGVPQFFDEVETAIEDMHSKHGVRIFNMSLNIEEPVSSNRYSPHAIRLDQISDTHDSLIFISAGNLPKSNLRNEWPESTESAIANLVSTRNDGIFMPAESVRNIAVAAINPPGDPGKIPFAPSRYSRIGPGLRSGNKPDLAHIGGFGTDTGPIGHGLFSITPSGVVVDGCGTSYAAPLVAKTAAHLSHAIEGAVSRETLIALLIHGAKVPEFLTKKPFSRFAKHLVGFGIPGSARDILETEDHEITLVFSARLMPKKQLNFNFNWPSSLVDLSGKCKGRARLTLVASPPLDSKFGAEFVRVNISAALQQENEKGGWNSRLEAFYLPGVDDDSPTKEADLIEHGHKWSPVKVYAKTMPRGVGKSSNWRMSVGYLTRWGVKMPEDGVPFTAILTIGSLKKDDPVFSEMRQSLSAIGVEILDIKTAARVTSRI